MDILINKTSTRTLVSITGELDYHTAPAFQEAVLPLLRDGRAVTADLNGVTFIDSSGLGALINARRHAERLGAAFLLAAVPPTLAVRLEHTGLNRYLSVIDPGLEQGGEAGTDEGELGPPTTHP